MITIKVTPYKEKAQADYDALTVELMGLPYDCKRAREIRRQQSSMEHLSPGLKQSKIDKMAEAARLHLPATEDAD